MKKLILTAMITLTLGLCANAEPFEGGGLFERGMVSDEMYYGSGYRSYDDPLMPVLPPHGESTNQDAPLGSGILLLAGLGAAYALRKRQTKE